MTPTKPLTGVTTLCDGSGSLSVRFNIHNVDFIGVANDRLLRTRFRTGLSKQALANYPPCEKRA